MMILKVLMIIGQNNLITITRIIIRTIASTTFITSEYCSPIISFNHFVLPIQTFSLKSLNVDEKKAVILSNIFFTVILCSLLFINFQWCLSN